MLHISYEGLRQRKNATNELTNESKKQKTDCKKKDQKDKSYTKK